MSTASPRSSESTPFPLGASWIESEQTYNFSLYSKHAERVLLLFFSADDLDQPIDDIEFDYLINKSGPIWHCRIAVPNEAVYYAYRVEGPDPEQSFEQHNFDFEKLLLDPYATQVYFPPDFNRQAAIIPGSNMGRAPLAVLNKTALSDSVASGKTRVLHRDSELIIYEMHVRGFTYHESSGVMEAKRGTYSGVIEKIPFLLDLGVTAVELMPIFQYDPDEENYWGYMPLNFFAPHNEYCLAPDECQQFAEFREMVDALHAAGIEVILDVVYNHTTEAAHTGPTYSFRGIDSSSYYMMSQDPRCPYADFSGTGNTLHTQNRAVRKLIVDSLLHWATQGGVDGFRFDLASIFTRRPDGSVSASEAPIFAEISTCLGLEDKHLIAEPWDAAGLNQLGQRFPGTLWMQWNETYRDTIQKAVRGDPAMVGDLMTRLYGSTDLFPNTRMEACHPIQSINFVTSHDGFTLGDLVSYGEKNNWANGANNLDGHDDFSYRYKSPKLREQQARNLICLLMLSNGVPMFRMGDEFLNSQEGNSNPYNQDNETSWLDWNDLEQHPEFYRFFKLMIHFRKAHPSISRSRFWREDIHWYGTEHAVDLSDDSRQLAYCLHGASQNDNDLYVMINLGVEERAFGIHEGSPAEWRRVIDTAETPPGDIHCCADAPPLSSAFYPVQPRSIVILIQNQSTAIGHSVVHS